jgi:TIR domain
MGKKDVRVFVSYARANSYLASQLLKRFKEQAGASKRFRYLFWQDRDILVGEDWRQAIARALDECTLGLLLVSPAFLGSQYVRKKELPRFVGNRAKPVIPVMLQPVDLALQDPKGLRKKQIFKLFRPKFSEAKSFAECSGPRRDEFAFELFRQVEGRLAKAFRGRRGRSR